MAADILSSNLIIDTKTQYLLNMSVNFET